MRDKHGLLNTPHAGPLHLELGCGASKRSENAIGIDITDHPGVDVVGDALEILRSLPTATVSEVSSFHFFEHVANLQELLAEIDRVLVVGGHVEVVVPHFANPYYYSDPTHRQQFGLYTFSYFCEDNPLRRKLPQYGFQLPWSIQKVQLRWDADYAFKLRKVLNRAVGLLFARSYRLMEFHESQLCWLFPCYEIYFQMRKDDINATRTPTE